MCNNYYLQPTFEYKNICSLTISNKQYKEITDEQLENKINEMCSLSDVKSNVKVKEKDIVFNKCSDDEKLIIESFGEGLTIFIQKYVKDYILVKGFETKD